MERAMQSSAFYLLLLLQTLGARGANHRRPSVEYLVVFGLFSCSALPESPPPGYPPPLSPPPSPPPSPPDVCGCRGPEHGNEMECSSSGNRYCASNEDCTTAPGTTFPY
eukprot:scaffold93009_cov60-Phaeocystis_antarctica.AAC.1